MLGLGKWQQFLETEAADRSHLSPLSQRRRQHAVPAGRPTTGGGPATGSDGVGGGGGGEGR